MPELRLIVNCRFLTRPVSGVERFALEITKRLVEARGDVVLVAPPAIPPGTKIAGKDVVPVGRLSGHLWEQISLPRYLRSVGSPLLLDLANTGPVLWTNQLYTLHDVAFVTHPESYRRSFRLWYRIMAGTLVRRAARVATVSTFSRDEIVRVFSPGVRPIDIIPNGVDEFRAQPDGAPADPRLNGNAYFLAVGSAARHKNIPRLLDAYSELRRRLDPAPSLAIVGGGGKGFQQEDLADIPGVVELGRVSDEQLARLYANALALVYPSLYEGFGIPPLEAQSAGTPVIVSRRRPFTDLLPEDSAAWCDPDDAASVTQAMESIAQSSLLRTQLAERGLMNARRYSWDEAAHRLLDILPGG